MIVVVGAAGWVGRSVVRRLAAHCEQVRAVTRRPAALAVPDGVEVVFGDADAPDSVDTAVAGADKAFLMSAEPVSPAPPTHLPRLVAAARRAGVSRLAVLSVFSGSGGDDVIGTWNRAAEDAVTSSGVPATLLRPGRFSSNAAQWAPMLRRGDVVHVPFADRPAAGIDPDDVAAVAVEALVAGRLEGRALQLTGPEVLTPAQEVAQLARVLDRPLEVVEVGDEQARRGMVGHGMAPEVVDAVIGRTRRTSEGAEVLPTVADVLGRPARTFAGWAAEHADLFSRTPTT